MINTYPYTDFHELNADWIISELKRISGELAGIYDRAVHDAVEQANAYTDSTLDSMQSKIDQLENDFDVVLDRVNGLEDDFSSLVSDVAAQIVNVRAYIDAQIVASNARTDAAIESNNETILSQLSQFLSQIKVINFFTGELVSVQDMFNYLAMLHLNDSIDYDTMAYRAKTYTEFVNMNMTYTNLVQHGNTLYI